MFWRISKTLLASLSILLIVGFSLAAVVTKIRHGQLLSVQSGSMAPELKKGDLVNVKRVPTEELNVGDIITFINPANKKQTITHRIISLPSAGNGQKFVTKGDANNSIDQPIEPKTIIGQVSSSVPKVGYAVDLVRQPLGLIFIIYLPALAIIISELKRLMAYYKTQEKYMLPWRRGRRGSGDRAKTLAKALPLGAIIPLLIFYPAWAALQTQATLTGNTISSAVIPPPDNVCPPGTGNTSTIVVTGGGGNINVTNSNNQNAQSGNASGPGATSGDATNCNSTNININVSNL